MQIQRRGGDMQPQNSGPLSLREAMGRLFDESFWDPFEESGLLAQDRTESLFPKVNISETDEEVKAVANIPGMDPENISIEVDEDSLTLSGTLEEEKEDSNERQYRFERECGEFYRDFLLPARVDPDKVSAESKNGVITIKMPKVEDKSGRKKVDVKKS
ncbi:MAG: Hsp20/alpha crystallin family protein [Patescibacteria group bacterium]